MTNSILGVDYGRERVGLALASQGAPRRLQTLSGNKQLTERLAAVISEHKVRTVVLGLPRTSDGNDTAWTSEVRRFAQTLKEAIRVPVILQDEFGTTAEAKARLASLKLDQASEKGLVDQESAVILLEDYLHAL